MQDVSEFLKASRKCKKSRETWYADELLELVAHIQEHAENKDISKVEYCEMLDAVIKRANLIKDKLITEKPIEILGAVCWDYNINANDVYAILKTKKDDDLTYNERLFVNNIFENAKKEDLEVLKNIYFIEIEDIKKIFLTSPYCDDKIFLDILKEYKCK